MVESDDRRAELKAKREQLYQRQAEATARQQRARDFEDFRRGIGSVLDEAGVAYQLLWPDDRSPAGPLATYPIGFASVHWPLVPEAVSVEGWHPDRGACVAEAFQALGVQPEATVVVDHCVGGTPRVQLAARDFLVHAEDLIRYESWLYELQGTWLVEVYHEGTISYAPRPGSPEVAGDRWRR